MTDRTTTGTSEVAAVWSGTPADFELSTCRERGKQFVAFYDAERWPTVGVRSLGEATWTTVRLSSLGRIGWDAHNDLALIVDDDGRVHVAGNVHGDPLAYARTADPGDVTTFERVPEMVGSRERQVTYPRFFRGPADELIFEYRDGESGGGDWLYNVYDHDAKRWRRLLTEPLTAGYDRMNAYPHGPISGPDGYYHCCWVWRDSPDAATNHDLSYARSADLREWETSRGEPLELPITIEIGEIVDPVSPETGLINGNTPIGFDDRDRVIVSYHKYDSDGNTQVYNARAEADGWEIARTSDWEYRWEFGGHGSIPFDIEIGPVTVGDTGRLEQSYRHVEYGSGTWILDTKTLEPVDHVAGSRYPEGVNETQTEYPGMQVNWVDDAGAAPDGVEYALRWETLGPNRDRKRDREPPATTLRCYEFETRPSTRSG